MSNHILMAALVAVTSFNIGYSQNPKVNYYKPSQYSESSFMDIQCSVDLVLQEHHRQNQMNFVFLGDENSKGSMKVCINFNHTNQRSIPIGSSVIFKLGTDDIIGIQTQKRFSSKVKGQTLFNTYFEVYLSQDDALKVAHGGIKKIRLSYSKKKVDWNVDVIESKVLAAEVYNSNLTAVK
ncbi:hypothetical protein [Reichenbachiella versicolor]|uniref:hypothetical protein n=1 Tax=Reichenbachiella versicolor TaxID=1821036 RepID=UPI0013A59B00|nr:hypothetical protein [Reichenbachiella versicolor]